MIFVGIGEEIKQIKRNQRKNKMTWKKSVYSGSGIEQCENIQNVSFSVCSFSIYENHFRSHSLIHRYVMHSISLSVKKCKKIWIFVIMSFVLFSYQIFKFDKMFFGTM